MWDKCSLASTTHNCSSNKVTTERKILYIELIYDSVLNSSLDLDEWIENISMHSIIFKLKKCVQF